jgi:hypothetical protein
MIFFTDGRTDSSSLHIKCVALFCKEQPKFEVPTGYKTSLRYPQVTERFEVPTGYKTSLRYPQVTKEVWGTHRLQNKFEVPHRLQNKFEVPTGYKTSLRYPQVTKLVIGNKLCNWKLQKKTSVLFLHFSSHCLAAHNYTIQQSTNTLLLAMYQCWPFPSPFCTFTQLPALSHTTLVG